MINTIIKNARIKAGLSQRELGELIGKKGKYISYLESKESATVSLKLLSDIAKALKLDIKNLIKEKNFEIKINAVKALREKNGLSQEKMAALSGISKSAITKYETGERTPNPIMLNRLANFFNVNADMLLKDLLEGTIKVINKNLESYDLKKGINLTENTTKTKWLLIKKPIIEDKDHIYCLICINNAENSVCSKNIKFIEEQVLKLGLYVK